MPRLEDWKTPRVVRWVLTKILRLNYQFGDIVIILTFITMQTTIRSSNPLNE